MPTPNMGLAQPTVGGSTGVWGGPVNTDLDIIDAHTHAPGSGVLVPSAGIGINADLTFAGFGITNLKYAGFVTQAASPAVNRSFWTKTSDGELYWRTSAGVDIKVTSGAGLNMSLVGGITGDYASVGASLYYDDANKTYRFLRQAPLPNFWASVSCGDLDLYEKASGITNRVRLKSPAALGASYDLTLPTAVPGATALIQATTAGALSFNATGNRVGIFASTLDCNSTVNLGTAVAAFTATAAITATDFKHTTGRVLSIPACSFSIPNGSTARLAATGREIELLTHTGGSTTPSCVAPVELDHGMRITSILFRVNNANVGVVVRLKKMVIASSSVTSVANATVTGGLATLSGLSETFQTDVEYWLQVEGMGTTGDLVGGAEVTYTRP